MYGDSIGVEAALCNDCTGDWKRASGLCLECEVAHVVRDALAEHRADPCGESDDAIAEAIAGKVHAYVRGFQEQLDEDRWWFERLHRNANRYRAGLRYLVHLGRWRMGQPVPPPDEIRKLIHKHDHPDRVPRDDGGNRLDWLDAEDRIPAQTECHWRRECPHAQARECKHMGERHPVPFSCAAARLFAVRDKVR